MVDWILDFLFLILVVGIKIWFKLVCLLF